MMTPIHDSGYKKLFSNKTIFRQLMETFVHEDWVKDIDFDTCETLDKSFVSDHYKETESDIIYKAKLKHENTNIYIFILLEFQSTVNHWMALRMLNYMTNFYMDFVQNNKQAKRLPAVFPVLLYNGDAKWTAPVNMEDLIESEISLGKFGVRFEYFKLAENEFTKENLLKIKNIVSTLFLSESYYDTELLKRELLTIFDNETDKQAVSLFLNWFKQMSVYQRIEPKDYKKLENIYKNHQEVKSMLITALEKERETLLKKGEEKGILQGKIEDAKTMLLKGLSVELISEITGLPVSQISKLKNS